MMNPRKTKYSRQSKWQNIVIIFILLFMVISALPNLYSDKVTLQLSSNNSQNEQLLPHELNALLDQITSR